MSLKLYFSPGACSFVPHVLLETSGADYEPLMVKLHKGEQYGDEYKAINPRSQVPVLQAEGQVITQIPAICQYLDMAFPQAQFLPTVPLARAKALETLSWMNNTVHPTFTHIFMPQKYSDQAEVQAQVRLLPYRSTANWWESCKAWSSKPPSTVGRGWQAPISAPWMPMP